MTADLHIDYDVHLRSGRVWRVELELPLQDAPDDVPNSINVSVDVVASTRDLAQYIAATIYPEYLSLCIDDEPLSGSNSSIQA
jgi:hypothetical protein